MQRHHQAGHEGHFHAVQFYEDASSLTRIVAGFLADGFKGNHPALVIATPEHRLLIEGDLRARSVDVDGLKRTGSLVVLDARETLAAFMVDGMPVATRFQHVAGEAIRKACLGRTDCTVRAYGEMVNLLWQDGLAAAAIKLETLWNELANNHDFKLLCGYAMGNFYKGAAIDEIKGQHSHLVDQTGETAIIN